MTDHQRVAAFFADLKAAASGHPIRDRLTRWVIQGGDEDAELLLALAATEAMLNDPCPQCGHRRTDDVDERIGNAVLDRLLAKQHSGQAAP
ncbi:hypothetical protein [Mycobacterium sp.]|uniref:hypothetical protein n=1 Tax=Mycobacterium sp. TaxID=1785 RepID=UPI003F99FA04